MAFSQSVSVLLSHLSSSTFPASLLTLPFDLSALSSSSGICGQPFMASLASLEVLDSFGPFRAVQQGYSRFVISLEPAQLP